MKKFIIILVTLFLSSIIYHLSSGIIYAQQITLSISPPLLEVLIKPGKSILIAYRIENLGDPVIIKPVILPFIPQDNEGGIKIEDEFSGPIRFELDNSYIKFNQPFFLKTRQSDQLLLRIRVPEGAPNGDYYYTLLAETQPPPTLEGISSSRAKATIGSNILITVTDSGKVEVKSKISLFDVLPRYNISLFGRNLKLFDSNDIIPISLIVENNGRNLIKPVGEIVLKGNFGEKANYDIIPKNILAESQRIMSASPSASVDCENKSKNSELCKKPISLLLSGFFIGNYKLTTKINFGVGTPNLYAFTSFVALPFKLIAGLTIIIFMVVFVLKKYNS